MMAGSRQRTRSPDIFLAPFSYAPSRDQIFKLKEGVWMKEDKEENKSSGCLKVAVDDYIECSGVHGVRYLGEKAQPLCERLCWAVTLVLSMTFSCYIILRAWQQWEESPTLWTFDEPMHVLDIPFPTVIICPPCHFDQDVFSMSQNFSNLSPEEKEKLLVIQLLCLFNFSIEQNDFQWTLNKSAVIKLLELPRKIDINDCTSHPQDIFCYPERIHFTMYGVCHTFNMLPASQIYKSSTVQYLESVDEDVRHIWNLEAGFIKNSSFNEQPFRRKELMILMIPTETQLKNTFKEIPKVKVTLTNPAEVSGWNEWMHLNISTWSYIGFEAIIIKASDGLRNYSPEKRKCYFPSERQLAYFTTYTKHNCEIECLTNMTFNECKCVDYHMPRIVGTPICGRTSWYNCSSYMSLKLDDLIVKNKMEGVTSEGPCNCLPSCVSLDFKMTLSKELTPEEANPVYLMQLHPKTPEFIVRRRIEKYTTLDFIAQSGGLLGLCCGISILSFVELFYHCTIRSWNRMKGRRTFT